MKIYMEQALFCVWWTKWWEEEEEEAW